MIIGKDGYRFDYTQDEVNLQMCKEYNRLLKRLGKIKLLSTFPYLSMLEFYYKNTPLYLFEPNNKKQIDKVTEVFAELSPYWASQWDFELNKKYILFFTDHLGYFEMHVMKADFIIDDINTLLEFKKLIYGE